MKKPIVHLYGQSKFYTYGTVCGLSFNHTKFDTIIKKKVTCKNANVLRYLKVIKKKDIDKQCLQE